MMRCITSCLHEWAISPSITRYMINFGSGGARRKTSGFNLLPFTHTFAVESGWVFSLEKKNMEQARFPEMASLVSNNSNMQAPTVMLFAPFFLRKKGNGRKCLLCIKNTENYGATIFGSPETARRLSCEARMWNIDGIFFCLFKWFSVTSVIPIIIIIGWQLLFFWMDSFLCGHTILSAQEPHVLVKYWIKI